MFIWRCDVSYLKDKKSSVSWQWLPDVVGEVCSYVDTRIFLLGEEESKKKCCFFFRQPRWKLCTLHSLQRALYEFLEESTHTEGAPSQSYGDTTSSTPMSREGWGELQGWAARSKSGKKCRPDFSAFWRLHSCNGVSRRSSCKQVMLL